GTRDGRRPTRLSSSAASRARARRVRASLSRLQYALSRASVWTVRHSYLPQLLLLSAIWGSSYMFIKVGVRDFSPASMVELRLLLAGAVLVSFVAARRGLRAVRPALAPGAFVGIRSEERRVGTACDYSDVRINNVYIAYWL